MKEILMTVPSKKIQRVTVGGVPVETYPLTDLDDQKFPKPEKHGPNKMGFEPKGPQIQWRVTNLNGPDGELTGGSYATEGQVLEENFNRENDIK